MAIDSGNVYWSSGGLTVGKIAKTGGAPTTIANALWGAHKLAVDSVSVFYTTNASADGAVMKTGIQGGGNPIGVAWKQPLAQSAPIALDAGNVYFVTSDGAVMKSIK